jgi:anti-anti-sigma factor
MTSNDRSSEDGFRVWSDFDGGTWVVRASGELDIASAKDFEAELRRALAGERSLVTLDLGEVEFIDSAGLRALLTGVELANMNGTRFSILREVSPVVERTFEVTGMMDRLPFID